MRLLITAQALDQNDPTLGFFVRWVEELSKHFEQVTVICLRKGEYNLPPNVRVFALGGNGKMSRAYKLIKGAYKFRNNYDAVFVHMSQEFVLTAGWLWSLLGKPVYLWRNHYAGSLLTDIAAGFCKKVFCTSKHSYTAKYRHTVLMPVGVDTGTFSPQHVERRPRSVLFLARMAPSKRPEMLLDALKILNEKGVAFSATFVGSSLPKDDAYYESLKQSARELGSKIVFLPGVPNRETPKLYSAHQVFVNCSPSGMYDKTLFEAAACGATVLASSEDWRVLVGERYHATNASELADKLATLLAEPQTDLRAPAQDHALETLASELYTAMV